MGYLSRRTCALRHLQLEMKQTLFSIVLIAILIYSEVVYAAHVSVGKRNKEMHQKLSEQELSGLAVKMRPPPPGISGERGAVRIILPPAGLGRREAAQQIPLGFPGKREAIELANSKPIDGHPAKRDLVKKQRKIANEEYLPPSDVGGRGGKREAVELANSKPIDGRPAKRDLVIKQRKIAKEEYPASEIANTPPRGIGGRGKREAVQKEKPPMGMQAS